MRLDNQPNILLIILDSARAKNTSLHGYERDTTPFLEDLSTESTTYLQARSPGIHSIASHASIWTGQHVEQHGAVDHQSILPHKDMIWSTLKEEFGYQTGLFTPNTVVGLASNLSKPFDTVVNHLNRRRLFKQGINPNEMRVNISPKGFLIEAIRSDAPIRSILNGLSFKYRSHDPTEETGDLYVDRLLEWIADQNDRWAACLNIMEPHYPYQPDPKYDNWGDKLHHELQESVAHQGLSKVFADGMNIWKLKTLQDLYDGGIRQADAVVEKLVTKLKSWGEFDNTLLVITSDHGEGFGETSIIEPKAKLIDHSWGIGEELTHIPLLTKFPGQQRGTKIREVATTRRFPEVVQSVLEGDYDITFVPDTPVLTSTLRLRESDINKYDSDMDQYRGPWRAVYEQDTERVIKYASRQNKASKINIIGTKKEYVDEIDVHQVNKAFDSQISERTKAGTRQISEDVEESLKDLGYVR